MNLQPRAWKLAADCRDLQKALIALSPQWHRQILGLGFNVDDTATTLEDVIACLEQFASEEQFAGEGRQPTGGDGS